MMCGHCAPPRASFRGGLGKARELTVTSLYRAAVREGENGGIVANLRISGRCLEDLGFARGAASSWPGSEGD